MMASPSQQHIFRYQSFCIDKSQPLGHGSYGAVYKAKCDQLPCAAKLLHATILDPCDPGADKIMQRFEQECAFLDAIRHPNIVQYLGVTMDPESRLPVLLMELLDESLTKMLERSQQLLPYCVQVDICHDIALAVAYLHSNDIIHRDLSSNNVLMIAGRRAKVTDFGMSRLAGAAPTMTPLTTCPGTVVYMAPEALREPPRYTKKLDCFSEGVLMIQVCTRLWPEPGPRTNLVPDSRSPTGNTEMPVLEIERRKNHIDLINCTNALLPIAKDCLKYQEEERPLSEDLCQRLAALKESVEYRDSVDQRRYKDNEITSLVHQIHEKDTEIQTKTDQLQQLTKELEEQERVTAEIKQTNHSLQRQVEQLQQQLSQQCLQNSDEPCAPVVLKWRDGGHTPFKMVRGAAAVDGDTAYFINYRGEACSYSSTSKKWSRLPKYPHQYASLAVVNGQVTGIGGWEDLYACTDKLLSLSQSWLSKSWVDFFPSMPTKRRLATSVTSEEHVIVAGGDTGQSEFGAFISPVEVMDAKTQTWSTVASLPHPYYRASATLCGDQLYMLGGQDHIDHTKSVLTCSLTELLHSSSSSSSVWRSVADAPAYYSTCAAVNGELQAIGGLNEKYEASAAIHRYNSKTNSWELVGSLPTSRWYCLLAVFPKSGDSEVLAAGGYKSSERETSRVDIASPNSS